MATVTEIKPWASIASNYSQNYRNTDLFHFICPSNFSQPIKHEHEISPLNQKHRNNQVHLQVIKPNSFSPLLHSYNVYRKLH